MNTFDKVSPEYKDKSLVQKNAAGRLLELLKIQKGESVIDVAVRFKLRTDILTSNRAPIELKSTATLRGETPEGMVIEEYPLP